MLISMSEKGTTTRDRLIPYQLPWTDIYGQNMPFKQWLWSRKFSILYIVIIWTIVGILGFASTRPNNCDKTWQLAFQCEQAIWMIQFYQDPWAFAKSLFTAPYFHNGLDHILFVTVFGFMMPVQSFEVQHGSKATVILFVVSYLLIGTFWGAIWNYGVTVYPENEILKSGFDRSWLGGSLGFYALIGSLSFFSRKKWFLLLMVLCFEYFINHHVIGIAFHISLIHVSSALMGWVMCWTWTRFDPKAVERIPA